MWTMHIKRETNIWVLLYHLYTHINYVDVCIYGDESLLTVKSSRQYCTNVFLVFYTKVIYMNISDKVRNDEKMVKQIICFAGWKPTGNTEIYRFRSLPRDSCTRVRSRISRPVPYRCRCSKCVTVGRPRAAGVRRSAVTRWPRTTCSAPARTTSSWEVSTAFSGCTAYAPHRRPICVTRLPTCWSKRRRIVPSCRCALES